MHNRICLRRDRETARESSLTIWFHPGNPHSERRANLCMPPPLNKQMSKYNLEERICLRMFLAPHCPSANWTYYGPVHTSTYCWRQTWGYHMDACQLIHSAKEAKHKMQTRWPHTYKIKLVKLNGTCVGTHTQMVNQRDDGHLQVKMTVSQEEVKIWSRHWQCSISFC